MTYYISLYRGAKRLVCHLRLWDGHVIIVSGCLILAAVNLIVLIRMVYITKRLVKLCKIYCDIWHRLTWSVCTGGRTLRHNQIFSDGKFTKFSYPWCSATRALCAHESSAKMNDDYSCKIQYKTTSYERIQMTAIKWWKYRKDNEWSEHTYKLCATWNKVKACWGLKCNKWP